MKFLNVDLEGIQSSEISKGFLLATVLAIFIFIALSFTLLYNIHIYSKMPKNIYFFDERDYLNIGALVTAFFILPLYFVLVKNIKENSPLRLFFSFFSAIAVFASNILLLIYAAAAPVIHSKYKLDWDVQVKYLYEHNMMFWIVTLFIIIYFGIEISLLRKQTFRKKDTFGGSREATVEDLKKADLIVPKKYNKIQKVNNYICYGKIQGYYIGSKIPFNSIVISKPGGGKGTSATMPFMLDCPFPIFVNDIKSEILQVCSAHRYDYFGFKAIIIDPYNWLLEYDPAWADKQTLHIDFCNIGLENIEINEYVTVLAAAIAEPVKDDKLKPFTSGALTVIEGVLFYVISQKKTLVDFFNIFADNNLNNIGKLLESYNSTLKLPSNTLKKAIKKIKECHTKGQLSEFGAGVSSTISEGIDFIGDEAYFTMFSKGEPERTFDIKDYLYAKADIYLIIPPHLVKKSRKFVKMVLGVIRSGFTLGSAYLKSEQYPIVLDEVAQLGYVEDIEVLYEVLRFEGVSLKLFLQDMAQLKVYQEKEEMFKAFDVLQFFEVQGLSNIRYIKELAGKTTVENKSVSQKENSKILNNKDKNVSTSLTGVDLMSNDKIREASGNKQILIIKNSPIIICDRNFYYQDSRYKNHYAENYTRKELRHLIDKEANLTKKKEIVENRINMLLDKNETTHNLPRIEEQATSLKRVDEYESLIDLLIDDLDLDNQEQDDFNQIDGVWSTNIEKTKELLSAYIDDQEKLEELYAYMIDKEYISQDENTVLFKFLNKEDNTYENN
ncbi:type IV secretory system conjugative DNA transfer family protein [Francisella philomiragia]|uniref:type IV secretory system conjugative DNA transfer family protein n=1 Tax=Francisella philomiragia TaxID=28110 RepID=UPI0019056EAB|nr:type IV secretory system conjugative DNA transfer family protein [Francisella philomiragia]MBK2341722.1 type IV secretory system conjugative DNA transfer family protein [Francisella philomiragia]